MNFPHPLVPAVAQALLARSWMLATAESCTGGLIAAHCTELPGSSQWFERGWVSYSNAAKQEMLGLPADALAQHGAVSEVVAQHMARGALRHSAAQVSVAVTGIAGPAGGSLDKPVGLVCFAWCIGQMVESERQVFAGERSDVRSATVAHALQGLLQRLPTL